jgi:predicted phage terminase large subunit-like protein
MIKGVSGILAVYEDDHPNKPVYKAGNAIIEWPSGARARCLSAESPERARGLNSEFLLCDEIGSWPDKDFLDQLIFGLRLGMAQAFIITTPRATPLVIDLHERADKDVILVTGGSYENKNNLSPAFISQMEATYSGTSLYDQEIKGELILRNENSLWSPEIIDGCKVKYQDLPDFDLISIGIDPALSTSSKADETGIVISARGVDGKLYVLADLSGKHQPHVWVSLVHEAYEKYSIQAPTIVICESNAIGHHTTDILIRDYPTLPVKTVRAVASKAARAAPISLLFEQGTVKMLKDSNLGGLEKQMLSWTPYNKKNAVDDKVDALVYSLSYLSPLKKSFVQDFELRL